MSLRLIWGPPVFSLLSLTYPYAVDNDVFVVIGMEAAESEREIEV